MVTADIPYSGDKTVNGKYSDEERMENRWVSYGTDRIHWIAYDPGQAYPVKKIVLYHIKCNVLQIAVPNGRWCGGQRPLCGPAARAEIIV